MEIPAQKRQNKEKQSRRQRQPEVEQTQCAKNKNESKICVFIMSADSRVDVMVLKFPDVLVHRLICTHALICDCDDEKNSFRTIYITCIHVYSPSQSYHLNLDMLHCFCIFTGLSASICFVFRFMLHSLFGCLDAWFKFREVVYACMMK